MEIKYTVIDSYIGRNADNLKVLDRISNEGSFSIIQNPFIMN